MTGSQDAAAVASHLDAGKRRIVVTAPSAGRGVGALPFLLSGQDGRTMVVTEFENLRQAVGELRAALGKDSVDGLDGDARVTVANYERAGLHARHMDDDTYKLVVLLPHRPENTRAASAIAERFTPAAMIQVIRGGTTAFTPDHRATLSDLPPPAAAQDNVVPLRIAS